MEDLRKLLKDGDIFIIRKEITTQKGDYTCSNITDIYKPNLYFYDEGLMFSRYTAFNNLVTLTVMKVYRLNNSGELEKVWDREEYIWTNIPKDTLVMVRNNDNCEWVIKYFKEYKDEKFYCYYGGASSITIGDEEDVTEWKQCKLYNQEEN